MAEGNAEGALAIYGGILRMDPDHATALADRGTTLAMLGRLDLALCDLERAFSLGYREASAYSAAGTVCLQRKDYSKALEYFGEALALDPGYALAYYNRSRASHEMGDHRAAAADLETCLKLGPDEKFRKLLNARLDMLRRLV